MKKILVTGGAGFIGSALIRHLATDPLYSIVNVDKLTYAGNLESIGSMDGHAYSFQQLDICDLAGLTRLFLAFQPDLVMHLAAESHVDRSIDNAADFMQTNVMGTFSLLSAALSYWKALDGDRKSNFRFHHVSTDEVYGDLGETEALFTEGFPYAPSSPYSASKASSDHLVRAWQRTYGLPTLITNCSNNYGPYQFPEKLVPLMILNALEGKKLPVYGDGRQIRDWLYVDDHVEALMTVANEGQIGETYNIGGHNEVRNIDVVRSICAVLDELVPSKPHEISTYADLITFVSDRPGHDKRYAIDATKIKNDLGWIPKRDFKSGIRETVIWYLNNLDWCRRIQDGSYQRERLGNVS